jgi:CRP-like cAMP-binding protein
MRREQTDSINSVGAWNRYAEGFPIEQVQRGSVLYQPNQSANTFFVLQSGQVALSLLSSEGRTLTLRVVEPGEVFGLVSILADTQYEMRAEALTALQLYRIPRERMLAQIAVDTDLRMALLEAFTRERQVVGHQIDEVAFKSVPARLATLLLNMSKDEAGDEPLQVPRRSHQQLADMINAYRETVTKVIKQFRAARLLEIDRSTITLLNPSRLEELAHGS